MVEKCLKKEVGRSSGMQIFNLRTVVPPRCGHVIHRMSSRGRKGEMSGETDRQTDGWTDGREEEGRREGISLSTRAKKTDSSKPARNKNKLSSLPQDQANVILKHSAATRTQKHLSYQPNSSGVACLSDQPSYTVETPSCIQSPILSSLFLDSV